MYAICLCGSTKFKEGYERWNRKLALWGGVTFSVAAFGHQEGQELTMAEKALLDVVHLSKIDRSDAIFVVTGNDDGAGAPYVGESTTREMAYARSIGAEVFFSHVPEDVAEMERRCKRFLKSPSSPHKKAPAAA